MELPLFPLHTVLCPGIALPLHVFENRYRLLAERCLDAGSPFGVVLIREGREVGPGSLSLATVGTFAEIRQAGHYPDGRFDLTVVGAGRFRLAGVTVGREPYLVGDVEPIDDDLGDAGRARMLAEAASRRFIRYLELLQPVDGEEADEIDIEVEIEVDVTVEVEGDAAAGPGGDAAAPEPMLLDEAARRLLMPNDPTALSYLLSGIVQVDLPRRQALLEVDRTDERLADLNRLLRTEIAFLGRRLAVFTPDPGDAATRRN